MVRDGVEVPTVVTKCCEMVEKYGMDIQGIYRLSGTVTKVARLKELMDRGMSPFLMARLTTKISGRYRNSESGD